MTLYMMVAAAMLCATADSTVTLRDVTVRADLLQAYQMRSSQTSVQVSRRYMEENFSGSLMQTLEGIPGVKAMSIGSGQSKPAIRGLGFNRMVVVEDGVKHEGQQWGDDHGLEIDQFSIDRVEVIKGPAALLYGSDAIGGVLNLYANHIPVERFEGAVQFFGRSNNGQLGLSARVGGKKGQFFYRAHLTSSDYADYRVPTDSIQYYSYYIRLKDRRLRNTAGRERDGSLKLGYQGRRFHTDFRLSDAYSKSGFFADAHGLEVRLSAIDYDRSRRDIDLPSQSVNHLTVKNHTAWHSEAMALDVNVAYQNNLRREWTEPIAHGYMPLPAGPLERKFHKDTYTARADMRYTPAERHELTTGFMGEYQHNRRAGWGFVLPDFESLNVGLYAMERFTLKENLILNAGVRYDHARTHIHSYSDWYKTPVGGDSAYKQRSQELHRHFDSFTWSAGVNYLKGRWLLKTNLGKSFRVPIPKELGADGVNYHIFRYERGRSDLNPEWSYQWDGSVSWSGRRLRVQLDPYLHYFPNYIYLTPTADYVEGLQLYRYAQSRVLRWGMEAQATYAIVPHWEAEVKGEYLYARQRSGEKKGYTLPFSTPWSADVVLRYSFDWKGEGFAAVSVHVVGRQSEIVPPEKPTDGHWTLNASFGKHFPLGRTVLKLVAHADNLLNRRYYDHTSYYRLIDVPEPGRNFSLLFGLEF